jgi:hypothetical protein
MFGRGKGSDGRNLTSGSTRAEIAWISSRSRMVSRLSAAGSPAALDCFVYRNVLIYPKENERIFIMLRRLLYPLIALITFSSGAFISDAYQTFINHGFSTIRRILRIESSVAANVPVELVSQIDAGLKTTKRKYTPGIVVIYFRTDLDGQVNYVSAMSGDPAFYQQGIEAAYQMRFSRRKYRGHPISTAGLIVYKFSGKRRIILELHKGYAVTTD